MHWKRILLFSLLFFILAVSLFYFALPNLFYRSRKDSIPVGAYVVPWMRPNPPISELRLQEPYGPPPFDIDSVMASALKISMTFNISIPGGTRIIPSTVYLGHDLDYLYVGGKFRGMGMNPVSTANETLPNCLSMYFDVADNGVLEQPESGFRFSAFIFQKLTGLWIYHEELWVNNVEEYGRAAWVPSDNYYPSYLPSSIGNGIKEYDNSTETVTTLLSKQLSCPGNAAVNALQMKPGERWVMGFIIELEYITDTSDWGDYVDGWPRNIYPYLSNDASWWPKLLIDLTNPPQTIPGQTTSGTKT
jgi:hypothetical protein